MTKPKGQKVYCLTLNGEVLGIYTNLKKLAIDMNDKTVFVSYGKLSRDVLKLRHEGIEDGKLKFRTKDKKDYIIHIETLQ